MFNLPIIPPLGGSVLFTLDIPNPSWKSIMCNTSPAQIPLANIPKWLTRLKGAIDENLPEPSKKKLDNTIWMRLTQLPNNAHLPLLRWRLLHALLTGPHFPVNHLQSQTQSQTWYAADTIITFIENLSEGETLESSFDDPSDKAHQTASAHFTTAHALMAARHAAECAAGKNDDAIVSAFTSLAAATVASGQDAQDFWLWAAAEVNMQLETAINEALTVIR